MNEAWEDRKLVRVYLERREERAFRELYRRHSTGLFRVILRLVNGRAEEAEEILQATWIRAVERLEHFEWRSSLRSWLTGVAIRCHREALRRQGRTDVLEPERLSELPVPTPPIRTASRVDLERAIGHLPHGYRTVLVLHDIEGYTHHEIGEMMGIQAGTSKSQLSRARRAVRGWLHTPEEQTDERRAV